MSKKDRVLRKTVTLLKKTKQNPKIYLRVLNALMIKKFNYNEYSIDVDKSNTKPFISIFLWKLTIIIEYVMIFEVILPMYLKSTFSLTVKG